MPLIERVIMLTVESLTRWSRFRPGRADIAYAGMNDIGRILWIVRYHQFESIDELLDAERRHLLSLDAFGVALRAMASDVEFAWAGHKCEPVVVDRRTFFAGPF
jgi:hypothetical protein